MTDNNQAHEVDLDKTDRLPILEGVVFDPDVADDAVVMEQTSVLPVVVAVPASSVSRPSTADFPRGLGVDLPSLAESVRTVEERIARQNAEYEALARSYEKARAAESAAIGKSESLTADLTAVRALLETEKERVRAIERELNERAAAAEAARVRVEESLREAERVHGESRTLKESLAARDATIVQVLHSLGERDAQLAALRREHAQMLPALEERSKAGAQLESRMNDAVARAEATGVELKNSQSTVAALTTEIKQRGLELNTTRHELAALKAQSTAYLENLRSREWRRGFDETIFRASDAKAGAELASSGALTMERDQLRGELVEVNRRLTASDELIKSMHAAAAADASTRGEQVRSMEEHERAAKELRARIAEFEIEAERLNGELEDRSREASEARAFGATEITLAQEQLAAAATRHSALEDRNAVLTRQAEQREQEMAVLVAHLQESRRPVQAIEAEVKRLTEELTAKTRALEQADEDNRALRATVERTKGALEEREFLIRRLERSESTNANVLGRIQTSIERLGAATQPPSLAPVAHLVPPTVATVECAAEFLRLDGPSGSTHSLGRRTRVGRAPGCELRIDSSSVSRHHALVTVGTREVVIEDLNSTNGVLVNGRKVSRHLLTDGDLVTIGEAQFRLSVKFVSKVLEAPPPAAG